MGLQDVGRCRKSNRCGGQSKTWNRSGVGFLGRRRRLLPLVDFALGRRRRNPWGDRSRPQSPRPHHPNLSRHLHHVQLPPCHFCQCEMPSSRSISEREFQVICWGLRYFRQDGNGRRIFSRQCLKESMFTSIIEWMVRTSLVIGLPMHRLRNAGFSKAPRLRRLMYIF